MPVASAVRNAGFDAGTGLKPPVVGALAAAGLGVAAALAVTAALVALVLPTAVAVGTPAAVPGAATAADGVEGGTR
jgi:hypothetical protein